MIGSQRVDRRSNDCLDPGGFRGLDFERGNYGLPNPQDPDLAEAYGRTVTLEWLSRL